MPRFRIRRVLIVATDGFEEWELFGPREILQRARRRGRARLARSAIRSRRPFTTTPARRSGPT